MREKNENARNLINLKFLAFFYRASVEKLENLAGKENKKVHYFAAYFQVRMAEDLDKLRKALWHNFPFIQESGRKIAQGELDSQRFPKQFEYNRQFDQEKC